MGRYVTYQQIRDSDPTTTYIDELGEYWTGRAIIEEMDVAGIDYNDPTIEWLDFFTADDTPYGSDTFHS